jgi:hypothetical protein
MKTQMKLILVCLVLVGWWSVVWAKGQQATISIPGIGQTIITAHIAAPKPTSPPFLTFETAAGKLLKRIDFALDGIDEYPSLLKFTVIHPLKEAYPFIIAVATSPGGSAIRIETAIIGFVNGKIIEVIPDHLVSQGLDGLCVGFFGKHQRLGLVYFEFLWEEAHYDPHRYEASFFEWTGDKFSQIGSKQTKNRYREWKEAAAELGYQCRYDFLSALNSYGCDFWHAQLKHQPDAE